MKIKPWIHCGFQTLVELEDIHYFTELVLQIPVGLLSVLNVQRLFGSTVLDLFTGKSR